MYGHPLQPKRCGFTLHTPDDKNLYVDEDITMNLCIYDLDEPNDDIRKVLHPEFDKYWANACEGIFEPVIPIGDGGVLNIDIMKMMELDKKALYNEIKAIKL